MQHAKRRGRGRPPGSGIDDRIWLRELGRIVALKPGTPPTTAIKALGITDPSTIRRLREKHKLRARRDGLGGDAPRNDARRDGLEGRAE